MVQISETLTFAWWNTKLSPPGSSKETPDETFSAAVKVVKLLCEREQVDFLALGEVTARDLSRLNMEAMPDYGKYDGTSSKRPIVDLGAIYNPERLILHSQLHLFDRHGKLPMKVASRLDLEIPGEDHYLHVFISHWPSPRTPQYMQIGDQLASTLKSAVKQLINDFEGIEPRIILMGDYNREPSDMEFGLLATRDRNMAMQDKLLIYNPFWRHLGESESYSCHGTPPSFGGSCLTGSLTYPTNWKTVDQIIVSSAFLGGSNWHLNEHSTGVIRDVKIGSKTIIQKEFDHFPVKVVFEKVSEDGGSTDD